MLAKVLITVIVVIAVFLAFVSTRKSQFRYERSGVINAPADKIYPYLCDFKKGLLWNPFAQKDPNMKSSFSGPEAQVGSVMEFNGNREAGSGKLEITKMIPNQTVEMKLTMTSPFNAENLVHYELTPEGNGTRFSWAMEGDGGFMGKLITVFMDCEKMIAGEFEKGIAQLKTIVEKN